MTRATSRKLLLALSNHFQFGVTGSSYISIAVAREATGIGSHESARRRLPHENCFRFSSVLWRRCNLFVKLLLTLTAMQRYCQNMSVTNIMPVNRFMLYSLYYVAVFGGYASAHHGQPHTQWKSLCCINFAKIRRFISTSVHFLLVLTLEHLGNFCLCRFWLMSYADIDHICHRVI